MKWTVRYPTILWTSIVAGLFSLIVCLLLTIDFVGRGKYELFDSPAYLALKAQSKEDPDNEQIQQGVRQLDRQLREAYFRRRRFMATGIYLLLGGVTLTLVTARWAASLHRQLPIPKPVDEELDRETRDQRYSRWAAIGVVTALLIVLSGLAIQAERILPLSSAELDHATPPEITGPGSNKSGKTPATRDVPAAGTGEVSPTNLPSPETYLAQWPRFRGPTGSGVSHYADVPDKWNVTGGEGILWKTAAPLPGNSSPVVWNDRVFLSGATADEQAVFGFDANSGDLVWRHDVAPTRPESGELEVSEQTGYAASTMATDGVRVYAIFATGDVVAVNFEGQEQWHKNLGIPKNPYGHASSLATHKDLLIVQLDQGAADDDLSKLIALHGATGEVAWEVPRKVPPSWATPIVASHAGRTMVITCVNPWVIAYSADDGSELWRAKCLGGEVGPSPVFADGTVYAANDASGMAAIRADGSGDVTETHIEWRTDIDVPDICSPLVTDKYVLLLAFGTLACFDRQKPETADAREESREPLWEEDLQEDVSSSPSQVGNRVYLFSEEGKAWIIEPQADKCVRIAECEMGEPCRTSPAFQPGRIYIRGDEHLFCIGG